MEKTPEEIKNIIEAVESLNDLWSKSVGPNSPVLVKGVGVITLKELAKMLEEEDESNSVRHRD